MKLSSSSSDRWFVCCWLPCVLFFFPCAMIFDSALASCTMNSRHYFMSYSSLFKIFTVVLLFVVLQGGGRSKNVILSVSCVPQMFIFSFMQKKNWNLLCVCDKVFLRTSVQMQYCQAIFSQLLSLQCCLKIQLRLLTDIFITILSTATAWVLLQMIILFLEAVPWLPFP